MRRATLISVAIAGCAAAFAGGVVASREHAPAPGAAGAGTTTTGVRAEVMSLLRQRYYRHVDPARLAHVPLAALGRALHDPYTQVISRSLRERHALVERGLYGGIGIHAVETGQRLIIDEVQPGGPAALGGLLAGDELIVARGRPVLGLGVDVALDHLRGPSGTRVRVAVRRPAGEVHVTLTRRVVRSRIVRPQLLVRDGSPVGVIGITEFADGTGRLVRRAARRLAEGGARAIVLDVRRNPGGFVDEAVGVAGAFLPAGSVVVRERGLHLAPLTRRTANHPAVLTELPLAVLVDGETASSAEIVAGALRDHGRALLVGTRTYGKGVIQDSVPLRSGAALKLTIAEYRTPAGKAINHRGLRPDIVVPKAGRTADDPVLERALIGLRAETTF